MANKFLYGYLGFYSKVKRVNKSVDWESVDDITMNTFTDATKKIDNYNKQDEQQMSDALTLFNQTQFQYNNI